MAVLYLVRHGETPFNDPTDILYPGTQLRASSEIPLNDQGKEDARQAGLLLRDRGIGQIIASDLTRTIQTAQIIQNILNVPLSFDSRLDTWDLGLLSGLSEGDVVVGPDVEGPAIGPIIEWYEQHPDDRPPGGETFNHFIDLVRDGIQLYETWPGPPLCLVTHGRIIDVLNYVRSGTGSPLIEIEDRPPVGTVIMITPGQPDYVVVKMHTVDMIVRDTLASLH